jgi:probable F420-dependent oxidoreductase
MKLGRIGVWSGAIGRMPAARARGAIEEIERLGFGAIWYPEPVGGKEALSHAALLLGWSDRIVVASGIASIWARDAIAMASAARGLTDAFPGRFLLGVGTSNEVSVPARGHVFSRPYTRMREYLDAMDEAPYLAPEPEQPVRRILAALGPRMLALAAERSVGAHPYFVPVEHTAFARKVLGGGPLLTVEQAVALADDRAEARRAADQQMEFYLARRPYRDNLKRLGWSQADMEGAGSDALLDAIVAWGDVDAVRARVQAHFDAGADHVCIQPLGVDAGDPQLDQLSRLAPALVEA